MLESINLFAELQRMLLEEMLALQSQWLRETGFVN